MRTENNNKNNEIEVQQIRFKQLKRNVKRESSKQHRAREIAKQKQPFYYFNSNTIKTYKKFVCSLLFVCFCICTKIHRNPGTFRKHNKKQNAITQICTEKSSKKLFPFSCFLLLLVKCYPWVFFSLSLCSHSCYR